MSSGQDLPVADPPTGWAIAVLNHPYDTIEMMSAPNTGSRIAGISSKEPGRLRIGKNYFLRMEHPDTDRTDWGILEELLFSGRYQRQDGKTVVFDCQGFVKGLDSIAFYEPVIDYSDMSHASPDQISWAGRLKKCTTIRTGGIRIRLKYSGSTVCG